jgi:hypothetical protein
LRVNQNTVSHVKHSMNAIEHDERPAGEAAELGTYRSLQSLAVLTLVLGVLSCLALFSRLFWIVPLVTLILGVAALRLLAANPEKIGRKAAIWGMALALLFGAWAPSRQLSRQWWLAGQARTYADAWMELVRQKKLREAHQLHGGVGQRVGEGVSLDEYYRKDRYAQLNYDAFFVAEPLKTFSELTGAVQVEFERIEGSESSLGSDSVTVRYRVTYDRDGQQQVLPIRVILKRKLDDRTGDYQWFVESVQNG